MKTIFIITLCLFNSFYCYSQIGGSSVDFNRIAATMNADEHHHKYNYKGVKNETDFIFTSLFIFYKSFISSQDGNSCSFTPSCSEYMMQAIKKKGMVVGAMAGFDRMMRCNGLSPGKYGFDYNKRLLIDPVN